MEIEMSNENQDEDGQMFWIIWDYPHLVDYKYYDFDNATKSLERYRKMHDPLERYRTGTNPNFKLVAFANEKDFNMFLNRAIVNLQTEINQKIDSMNRLTNFKFSPRKYD